MAEEPRDWSGELRLPVPAGRVHEDYLSSAERAVVDWLFEIPDERLRAVIKELISLGTMRAQVEAALREAEGE